MKVYDGTSFVNRDPVIWDGTKWVRLPFKYWDGGFWQPTAVLGQRFALTYGLPFTVQNPPTPPAPPVKTYTKTKNISASWAQSYRGNGSQRSGSNLYQGYYAASNGNQRSLVGFNFGSFPAGSECLEVKLTLYANHWWSNGGGICVLGTHNNSSKPSTFGGADADRTTYTWNSKTGARTITLSNTIGDEFIDGSSKGICIGPGDNTGTTYYGYFQGTGGLKPSISIKYRYTQ